jgi:hypothetical protein
MNRHGREIGVPVAIIILFAAGCGGTGLPSVSAPDTTFTPPTASAVPIPSPAAVPSRVAIPAKVDCGPLEPFFGYREPPAPGGPMGRLLAMAYDARAGDIVSVWEDQDFRQTWTFDVCGNSWSLRGEAALHAGVRAGDPPIKPPAIRNMAFDADSDRMVAIGDDGRTWTYDSKFGAWTDLGLARPTGPSRLVYDPTTGLIVAIELSLGQFADFQPKAYTFDVAANARTQLPTRDLTYWHDVIVECRDRADDPRRSGTRHLVADYRISPDDSATIAGSTELTTPDGSWEESFSGSIAPGFGRHDVTAIESGTGAYAGLTAEFQVVGDGTTFEIAGTFGPAD